MFVRVVCKYLIVNESKLKITYVVYNTCIEPRDTLQFFTIIKNKLNKKTIVGDFLFYAINII